LATPDLVLISANILGLIYDFHYVRRPRLRSSRCKRIWKTCHGQFGLGIVLANPGVYIPSRIRAHTTPVVAVWY